MAKKNLPTEKIDTNRSNIVSDGVDKITKKILSSVDPSYSERELLTGRNAKFNSILEREKQIAFGVAGGSVVDFVASVKTNSGTKDKQGAGLNPNTPELFSDNIDQIFSYFQDANKNKHMEMSDLKFISKFIPVLGDAVTTTLDSITTSDNISESISRTIELGTGMDKNDKSIVMNEIEAFEKELKLLKKLKNVVYKNTLVTGKYYVYAKSYQSIFDEYSKKKSEESKHPHIGSNFGAPQNNNTKASESDTSFEDPNLLNMEPAFESLKSFVESSQPKQFGTGTSQSKFQSTDSIMSDIKSSLSTVTFEDCPVLGSALEQASLVDANVNNPEMSTFYKKLFGTPDTIKVESKFTADGTKDTSSIKSESFKEIHGTYIKYIDYKNIVPIQIFGETICYFYIHTDQKKSTSTAGANLMTSSSSLFSSLNVSERKKQEAISSLIESISDGILTHFNKKLVIDNSNYKKIIADCIISNGLVDNEYKIQIIPAEDILEFKINETAEDEGESILSGSLFSAKLLLYFMIYSFLNYVNNSGDRTIAHVHKGPIDLNTTNQLNRVIRMMQESKINFNDLLSSNMVLNKFSKNANMSMPTSQSGQHLVEFEVQEGQHVDFHTDFEDRLEKMSIMGTNVPTTILQYSDENAAFEKQIISANIKYAGHICSLDSDLEEPTTELYKKLIANSNLNDDLKKETINVIKFKLPRPKVAANNNNSDFLNTVIQTANSIADTYLGEKDDKNIEARKEVIKAYCRSEAPFIDWDAMAKIVETAILKANENTEKAKASTATANSDDGSADIDNDDL